MKSIPTSNSKKGPFSNRGLVGESDWVFQMSFCSIVFSGRYDRPPEWTEILAYFRGSELQIYFTKILEDNLKALIKPQYVDNIPKAVSGQVGGIMK